MNVHTGPKYALAIKSNQSKVVDTKIVKESAQQMTQQTSSTIVATSERRSSITQSSQQVSTSSERRSSITQESVKETSKKQVQTQNPGIDTNQKIVIVPGHQKVEFDAVTNTKTVTERTTTGYQQTITTVNEEGLTRTQVKTFFNPVEVASEETIEEEEEIYEETQTTEPTTKKTSTKTIIGESSLVNQLTEKNTEQTTVTSKDNSTNIISREIPQTTVTKKVLGEENVHYETIISEDGLTTTTRKIVTQPAEEEEIVEYEEVDITEPREVKIVTTSKTYPVSKTSGTTQIVEEVTESTESLSTEESKRTIRSVPTDQVYTTPTGDKVTAQTVVSNDGRKVNTKTVIESGVDTESVEYEEEHIQGAAVKPKTVTKTTTIPNTEIRKNVTVDEMKTQTTSTSTNEKLTESTQKIQNNQTDISETSIVHCGEDNQLASIPQKAVVRNTLPDGQEVEVESTLSEDGKTKILKKTVRQPEEEIEVEDYEETSTVVPKTHTTVTASDKQVVAVRNDEDEMENTIKTDKTKTVRNKEASETILVSAETDRAIGQHQEVVESTDTTNVKGVATTKIDDSGRVSTNVAATTSNTKTLDKEENTVLGNTKKSSKSSETSTKTTTIISSQNAPIPQQQRLQRDSLTDTNLSAIQQKQLQIPSNKSTNETSQKQLQQKMETSVEKSEEHSTNTNTSMSTSKNTTDAAKTTSTNTKTTTTLTKMQQEQKSQMLSKMKLTTADKEFTSSIESTTTDPATGEVTTEEVRRFAGGTEHIFTTVCNNGCLKMHSKTFFDSVPVTEDQLEDADVDDQAKKKLRAAVSSNDSPVPPPRKREGHKQETTQKGK